jgi:hypothetical protein
VATYRVTIVLYPGGDPAAVARRLAAMLQQKLRDEEVEPPDHE